ncbi:MAG: hypothetical protein Q9167_000581 [Letrouitia subvulpina]
MLITAFDNSGQALVQPAHTALVIYTTQIHIASDLNKDSTSYTRVVPTVFHVGTGTAKSDYITRKLTPYTPPGQKKRALTDAPVPTSAPELDARQAALPPFASSCGGDANRLSSACTCLIGNAPETITITAAQNQPGVYTTVGVCGATDGHNYNYELQSQGGFYDTYNNRIVSSEFYEINDINVCCKKCFRTPEWSVLSTYYSFPA